jgi:hypothetical protein
MQLRRILGSVARFSTNTTPSVLAAAPLPTKPKISIVNRLRLFSGGFIFASALGFYAVFFNLQGMLDELLLATEQVKLKQQEIQKKLESNK